MFNSRSALAKIRDSINEAVKECPLRSARLGAWPAPSSYDLLDRSKGRQDRIQLGEHRCPSILGRHSE